MSYKKIIIITPSKKIYSEFEKIFNKSKMFKGLSFEIKPLFLREKDLDKEDLIISVGMNSFSGDYLSKRIKNFASDGYIIKYRSGKIPHIVLGGKNVRSDIYAAWHLVNLLENREFRLNNIKDISVAESPAFDVRCRYTLMTFTPELKDSPTKVVSDIMGLYDDPERQYDAASSYILEVLRYRFNTIILTSYSMDFIDFDEIGFGDIYGADEKFKVKMKKAIRRYQQEVKKFIDICHAFGLRVQIDHCGIIGFIADFKWENEKYTPLGPSWVINNFFKAHPDAEAKPGRDDPSINWHSGKEGWSEFGRFFCPSHPLTWKFVKAYYKYFFKLYPIDEFSTLIGDNSGGIHCGCSKCKKFKLHDRIRKLIKTIYFEMKASRPKCILYHGNDDYVNFHPGKEVEMEEYVLKGLPDARLSAKWAQPMNFDFGSDWRIIYMHPQIGMKNIFVRSWYGWNEPTPWYWFGQFPQIYKEQFLYLAYKGVKSVSLFHEAYDDRIWLNEPFFYNEKECKYLEPYHFDIDFMVKCLWNPFNIKLSKDWLEWLKSYFGKAGVFVHKAFENSVDIMDVLGMWDIGNAAGGGVPPFSYIDKIFKKEDLKYIASLFYIRAEVLEKQSSYPRAPSYYDVTATVGEMIGNLKKASSLKKGDETLTRWVGYAKDYYKIALSFKLYHEAYFGWKEGNKAMAIRKLEEALKSLKDIKDILDYGKTTFAAWFAMEKSIEYYIEDIGSQLNKLKKGKIGTYEPYRHWKGGACKRGEKRDFYIYEPK